MVYTDNELFAIYIASVSFEPCSIDAILLLSDLPQEADQLEQLERQSQNYSLEQRVTEFTFNVVHIETS